MHNKAAKRYLFEEGLKETISAKINCSSPSGVRTRAATYQEQKGLSEARKETAYWKAQLGNLRDLLSGQCSWFQLECCRTMEEGCEKKQMALILKKDQIPTFPYQQQVQNCMASEKRTSFEGSYLDLVSLKK